MRRRSILRTPPRGGVPDAYTRGMSRTAAVSAAISRGPVPQQPPEPRSRRASSSSPRPRDRSAPSAVRDPTPRRRVPAVASVRVGDPRPLGGLGGGREQGRQVAWGGAVHADRDEPGWSPSAIASAIGSPPEVVAASRHEKLSQAGHRHLVEQPTRTSASRIVGISRRPAGPHRPRGGPRSAAGTAGRPGRSWSPRTRPSGVARRARRHGAADVERLGTSWSRAGAARRLRDRPGAGRSSARESTDAVRGRVARGPVVGRWTFSIAAGRSAQLPTELSDIRPLPRARSRGRHRARRPGRRRHRLLRGRSACSSTMSPPDPSVARYAPRPGLHRDDLAEPGAATATTASTAAVTSDLNATWPQPGRSTRRPGAQRARRTGRSRSSDRRRRAPRRRWAPVRWARRPVAASRSALRMSRSGGRPRSRRRRCKRR